MTEPRRQLLTDGHSSPHSGPCCLQMFIAVWGFPGGSGSKGSACNAGDPDLTPRLGRSPGERAGYPLQYSCLEDPMDRVACRLKSMGSQRVRHD